MTEPDRIRKSMLFQWRLCPRLYESVWLLKLPVQPGVEQQYGQMFHKSAKVFFDKLDYEALEKCQTAKEAYQLFSRMVSPKEIVPVLGPWLDNFFQFEARRWEIIVNKAHDPLYWWTPVATEQFLIVQDREYHIDRIDRLSNGNLLNIEYKTDKWMGKSLLRLELTWYNIGVNDCGKFERPCTHIGSFNPQLNQWFYEPVLRRHIQAVNRLVAQFRLARKLNEFPPRPSHFCRYCPVLSRCLADGIFNEKEDENMREIEARHYDNGEVKEWIL